MNELLDALGIKTPVIIAGIAGGITSLYKKTKLSYFERFIAVVSGGFTANYLTPLAAEWINLSENTHYGLAFLLGYGGLASVEMLWHRLHKNDKKDSDADSEQN